MRGPYDTPKRSHVIKTRLDDDEYEFFLRKCQVYDFTSVPDFGLLNTNRG